MSNLDIKYLFEVCAWIHAGVAQLWVMLLEEREGVAVACARYDGVAFEL